MLSSLIPRTESLALWRSWGVYLAQDFNHYKTDSAESICLNLIQSAEQSHTWQEKSFAIPVMISAIEIGYEIQAKG